MKAEPLTERESIAVCQAADDRALLRQFEMVTDEQLDEEIEGHELAIAEMDLADDASARTMRLYRLALDSLKRLRRLRALERAGSD